MSRQFLVGVFAMALVAAATACGAASTEVIENSFTVADSPQLTVDGSNGSVTVKTGPAGTVTVQATLRRPERIEYSARLDGNHVIVEAKVEGGGLFNIGEGPGANIEVVVPADTVVDLRTSNGGISLSGLAAPGSLRTSNGGIGLTNVTGRFEVETSNGSVDVDGASGEFDIETSNGSIDFSGTLEPDSENRLRTSNGRVTVSLLSTPGVDLDASTSNGSVNSSRPVEATFSGTRSELVGTIGGGGPKLLIRSSNGSIDIR